MELDFCCVAPYYNKYKSKFSIILTKTCEFLKIKADIIISVSIINNDSIRKLNFKYRKIDKETDVISFAFLDNIKNKDQILHKNAPVVLGDIYISFNKAKQQAKEYGNSLDREMSFLFVHGLLHLLGYDHMSKKDEEIMFPLQEKILSL